MADGAMLRTLRAPWLHARSLDVLASALIISIAAALLTNNVALPHKLLYWTVLPALVLVLATRAAWLPVQTLASVRRGIGQTSLIALAVVVYLAILVIATYVNQRGVHPSGFRPLNYLHFAIAIVIFVVACAYAAADPRRLRAMLLATAVLVAIHSTINIVIFVKDPTAMIAAGYRLQAEFGTPLYRNATHMAPLAAMFGMGVLALVATTRSRSGEQQVAVFCVLILVIAVLMTQSRGAIVAVTACALVIAVVSRGSWRFWILSIGIAAVATVYSIPSIQSALFARADSFRIALSKSYLKLAAAKPWFGYGLDREMIVTVNNTAFEQPHNAFVWAAVRGGVPAGLLAALVLLLALYWSYRYWRATGNAALLVLMLALGVTSMTEIAFMVMPYNWIWLAFWLPIGLAAGAERAVRQRFVPAPLPAMMGKAHPERPRYLVRSIKIELLVDRAANKVALEFTRTRNESEISPAQNERVAIDTVPLEGRTRAIPK